MPTNPIIPERTEKDIFKCSPEIYLFILTNTGFKRYYCSTELIKGATDVPKTI